MKIVSVVLSVVLMLGVVLGNNAYAGDAGWYAAGGLLAGLVAGAIITDASRPRYYYDAPVYAAPVYATPVYSYAPVYTYNRCYTYSNYVPAYTTTTVYETQVVQTW